MTDIILHHSEFSPLCEKIRRILAYKKLAWCGVEQPVMAPKPDLVRLTGGYHRLPVLQIGADIYCDTTRIARELERLQPEPACVNTDHTAARHIECWADHQFLYQVMPPVIEDIVLSSEWGRKQMRPEAAQALEEILAGLDWLNSQLKQSSYLLGERFSYADAACFHPLWMLKKSARLFTAVAARSELADWFTRIESFGPGDCRPVAAATALAIARESTPMGDTTRWGETEDFKIGERVTAIALDGGSGDSCGSLLQLSEDEITILREDPALGVVAVHFPRPGFRLCRTRSAERRAIPVLN